MYNTNQMIVRLTKCGLTKPESVSIMSTVDAWIVNSGVEWTVSHLKLIKQTVLSLYGKNPNGVSPYVRTKNGRLAGPFRAVERLLVAGNEKALSAMLLYTSWVSKELTATQKSKFTKACTAEPYCGVYLPSGDAQRVFEIKLPKFSSTSRPFGSEVDRTRSPDWEGKSFDALDTQRSSASFVKSQLYRDLYYGNAGYLGEEIEYFTESVIGFSLPVPSGHAPIGKVSVIQEPGLKARFIANPNRLLQHMLGPLGDHLFKILHVLPWDCTHDQNKPVGVIQERLKKSHRAHCFDLSNATDYFPLDIQIQVCINLFGEDPRYHEICAYLRLFCEAARSDWFFESGEIRWTRGQPLGLYPSFALFALAHGMVLYDLLLETEIDKEIKLRMGDWKSSCHPALAPSDWPPKPCVDREVIKDHLVRKHRYWRQGVFVETPFYNEQFFILGDDVIILDDDLAERYLNLMAEIGVPVNKSKSLVSDILAEFAGQLILTDFVYSPYKWRLVSWASVVPFLKHWGVEGISLLPRHLREWATLVAHLPEPVGLGFNPEGISLGARLGALWELYLDCNLPALTEVRECLGDVLKAMPEGSKLSYYTTPAMERPVPIPLKQLATYLTPMDVKHFLEDLMRRGLLTLAMSEIELRHFGLKASSEVTRLDSAMHQATGLVSNQKAFAELELSPDEIPEKRNLVWVEEKQRYRKKTTVELLFGVERK